MQWFQWKVERKKDVDQRRTVHSKKIRRQIVRIPFSTTGGKTHQLFSVVTVSVSKVGTGTVSKRCDTVHCL